MFTTGLYQWAFSVPVAEELMKKKNPLEPLTKGLVRSSKFARI